MAVIPHNTPVYTAGNRSIKLTWPSLDGEDTGQKFDILPFNDLLVQVKGTFDSNTLTMQGSNTGEDGDWVTLKDYLGLDVTFTAAGANGIATPYAYIRPSLGAGASSDVTVILVGYIS